MTALRKAFDPAHKKVRVWGGRETAQCEQRTRLRSSSVSSRSARDPLEIVAAEPQTLPFRGIEMQFHGREDPIVDS